MGVEIPHRFAYIDFFVKHNLHNVFMRIYVMSQLFSHICTFQIRRSKLKNGRHFSTNSI